MSAAVTAPHLRVVPRRATYAEAHTVYRRAGWIGPLPLPAGAKWPPPDGFTGWHGAYPSGADSQAWIDDYSEYATTCQLALRMADDVIGLDVDHYGDKRGGDTLAEAERRWGKLPLAPRSSARADPLSGIRFYRVPKGTTLRTRIVFPELGLGGIEVIQRHHRYAVVWPSIHPSEKTPYIWHETSGPDAPPQADKLYELPAGWIEALKGSDEPGEAAADPETVAAFAREHDTGTQLGAIRGVLSVFERDAEHGTRHDAMVSAACMGAREARAGRYPAGAVKAALREAFTVALAQARPGQRLAGPAESRREFDSMWAWAVGQALTEPAGARARESALPKMNGHVVAAPVPAPETPPALTERARGRLNLPAEFWDARPALKHIQKAALASWACPDAVLGAVLARLSAYAHPEDCVDMGIGRSPLTMFSILYGSPSAGKGIAVRTAAELLPVPEYLAGSAFRERPIGSGEGITESYYGLVSVTDEKGKTTKVRQQVRHNALFVMDEGETMVRLMTRNGSTLATTIRRAWSGEVLGEANASAERDRQLDRRAYSIGLTVAFQPAAIAPLFNEAEIGGGTPHRFLYLAADDDTLPEEPPEDLPVWPGALELPVLHDPQLAKQWSSPPARTYRLMDEGAQLEVQLVRWRGLRRDSSLGEMDGHTNQMRGRVAAHLAALDGRLEVTGEDWLLAGQVLEVSGRVREAAVDYGRRQNAARAQEEDRRHVDREAMAEHARLSVAEQQEQERLRKGAAVLARKVLRAAPVDGLATGALRDAAGRYKRDVAACLELAVELGWLATEDAKQGGTRYRVGPQIGEVPS